MKILFGTIFSQKATPEQLPASPAETSGCIAVPGGGLFAAPEVMRRLTSYLKEGGELLVTDAVKPGLINQIFREERKVRVAFVREFRAWCRQTAAMGVHEIVLPLDVTAVWRTPAVFSGIHALLSELAGIFRETHLLCRLPLTVPQELKAAQLAEFHRMLVPEVYSWLLTGTPDEAAAAWVEPLRFYADCWIFPAESDRGQIETFLQRAGRCARFPVKVCRPADLSIYAEPDLLSGGQV